MTITTEELAAVRAAWSGGSDTRYIHPLNKRLIYSEGVRDMAQQARCYWLLDIIATEVVPVAWQQWLQHQNHVSFLEVRVLNSVASLSLVLDSGEPPLWQRTLEYADLPNGSWPIWLGIDGTAGAPLVVAYLPEEH